jgi:hypothetical protein
MLNFFILSVIILSVVMLIVLLLSVVMLGAVAPFCLVETTTFVDNFDLEFSGQLLLLEFQIVLRPKIEAN